MSTEFDSAKAVELIQNAYRHQNSNNNIIVTMMFYDDDVELYFKNNKFIVAQSMDELCKQLVNDKYKLKDKAIQYIKTNQSRIYHSSKCDYNIRSR